MSIKYLLVGDPISEAINVVGIRDLAHIYFATGAFPSKSVLAALVLHTCILQANSFTQITQCAV